jgi:hypothetical protein
MTTAVLSYHDDWLVNVLLSNGEVFTFNTEMWPEHSTGLDLDWLRVVRRAKEDALDLAERKATPFCRVDVATFPFTENALAQVIDEACEKMSDKEFREVVYR